MSYLAAIGLILTGSRAPSVITDGPYLHHVGEVLARDRGLSVAIEASRATVGSEPRGTARAELESAVRLLIEKDRAVRAIRDDCTVRDVYMIAGSLSAAIRTGGGDWQRLLDLILNGLRPR